MSRFKYVVMPTQAAVKTEHPFWTTRSYEGAHSHAGAHTRLQIPFINERFSAERSEPWRQTYPFAVVKIPADTVTVRKELIDKFERIQREDSTCQLSPDEIFDVSRAWSDEVSIRLKVLEDRRRQEHAERFPCQGTLPEDLL